VTSNASVNYGSSPSMLALGSYATASNFFNYADTNDCGALTCELKAAGCSDAWADTDHVTMDSVTYAVSVKQDTDDGYVKPLCVKC
jgi:hypothetical protein